MSPSSRCCLPLVGLCLGWAVLYGGSVQSAEKGRSADRTPAATGPVITPSPKTTLVTEPVDAEGYVDFLAVLNSRYRAGVAPAENAAIPLLEALGPAENNPRVANDVRAALGMPPLQPGQQHLLNHWDFLKQESSETTQAAVNQFSEVTQFPWTSREHPEYAALLKQNERPLALVGEGVQRPKYFRPLTAESTATLVSVLLPDIQASREIARQLQARAMLHLGEGRLDAARQDLLTMHRLGRHIGSGMTLIEALVGIAIDSLAARGDNVWAIQPGQSPAALADYRRQLAALPPVGDMTRAIDNAERIMSLDVLQAIARGRVTSLSSELGLASPNSSDFSQRSWLNVDRVADALRVLSIDWNSAMQTINGEFDLLVAACRQPDRASRVAAIEALNNRLKSMKVKSTSVEGVVGTVFGSSRTRGKNIAEVLATLLMPAVQQAYTAQDRSVVRWNLSVLVLGVAEYRAVHGAYPTDLQQLTPDILDELPADVFANAPYRYRSDGETFVLYSVGSNGRDDDGVSFGPNRTTDDIVVSDPVQP